METWINNHIARLAVSWMAYIVTVGILGEVGVTGLRLTIWLIFGPILVVMVGVVVGFAYKMVRDEMANQ